MRAQLTNHEYEQLSAYIDGQLAPGEQRRLEERLRARPEMQEALEDLQRMRTLLRSVPRRRAPRNFTLTPAMVGEQGGRRKRGGFSFNLFPALSFASVVATFALVASIVFGLLPGFAPASTATNAALPAAANTQPSGDVFSNRAAEPQSTQAPAAAAPSIAQNPQPETAAGAAPSAKAADQPAPPVVTWSNQTSGGLGGGDGTGNAAAINPYGYAYGMGGGGGGGAGLPDPAIGIYQQYGIGGTNLLVPPESVQSLPAASEQRAASPSTGSETNVTGNGPILGVPQPGDTGKVLNQSADLGLPGTQSTGPTIREPAPSANTAAQQPEPLPALFGLPRLVALQILLGVIAIATGLAAWLVRRRA